MNTLSNNHTLIALLDKNREFALNGRGTTNHCPMALTALAAMGAGPDRLRAFFEHWREQYALPASALGPVVEYPYFAQYLGQRSSFRDLQECFAIRMTQRGAGEVVRDVLATIPFAPATTAFHALIRLAYGLQTEHVYEMATGLAALVAANFAIEIDMDGRVAAASVAAGFESLSTAMAGKIYPGRMIVEKMQAVINDELFQENFPAMPDSEDLLDELALWAISAYWQTRDFTILHMVTGVNAARQLLPYMQADQLKSRLQDIWLALCVAYVSVGAPALLSIDACLNKIVQSYTHFDPWPALFRQAIQCDDDHVIKFTYTCSREAACRPNALYQAAVTDILTAHAEPVV